jgi:hypothetical protein
MAWLGKLLAGISNVKKVIDFLNGLFSFAKAKWRDWQAKKAKESVDETTQTGDQRKEEAAIGNQSGVPHVDPDGGLLERPVRKRDE